jgi:hypothetical protein
MASMAASHMFMKNIAGGLGYGLIPWLDFSYHVARRNYSEKRSPLVSIIVIGLFPFLDRGQII